MTNDLPWVCILAASYKHVKYLPDFLASLEAQTYPNIYCVFSDDCSNDGTKELMMDHLELNKRELKPVKPQLAYTKSENLGCYGNFKFLMSRVPGFCKYVQIWETDDYLKPDSIEKRVAMAEAGDWDVVHSDVNMVYEDGSMKFDDFWANHSYPIESPMSFDFLLMNNRIFTISQLVRKEVFEKAYDFDFFKDNGVILCDYAAGLRMVKSGAKVGYLNETTAYYREVPHSVTHSMTRDKLLEATWKVQDMARNGELFV